jgi:hypothetical protein
MNKPYGFSGFFTRPETGREQGLGTGDSTRFSRFYHDCPILSALPHIFSGGVFAFPAGNSRNK